MNATAWLIISKSLQDIVNCRFKKNISIFKTIYYFYFSSRFKGQCTVGDVRFKTTIK